MLPQKEIGQMSLQDYSTLWNGQDNVIPTERTFQAQMYILACIGRQIIVNVGYKIMQREIASEKNVRNGVVYLVCQGRCKIYIGPYARSQCIALHSPLFYALASFGVEYLWSIQASAVSVFSLADASFFFFSVGLRVQLLNSSEWEKFIVFVLHSGHLFGWVHIEKVFTEKGSRAPGKCLGLKWSSHLPNNLLLTRFCIVLQTTIIIPRVITKPLHVFKTHCLTVPDESAWPCNFTHMK